MKNILFTLFLSIATLAYGQMETPVTISASVDVNGTEATVMFKASIQEGWHMYSANLPSGGPTAATVEFETLEGAELVGGITPGKGEIEKDDPIFGMKVKYFENEATFTQKVKLLGGKYRLQGFLRYGVCNDENCMPPTTYEFDFDGTIAGGGQASQESKQEKVATTDTESPDEFTANSLWKPVTSELAAFKSIGTNDASRSLWLTFLLGFGGGFLALLTPCVWPIIPMTVSFFLKRSGNRKKA